VPRNLTHLGFVAGNPTFPSLPSPTAQCREFMIERGQKLHVERHTMLSTRRVKLRCRRNIFAKPSLLPADSLLRIVRFSRSPSTEAREASGQEYSVLRSYRNRCLATKASSSRFQMKHARTGLIISSRRLVHSQDTKTLRHLSST
jgi:hypothetical protein